MSDSIATWLTIVVAAIFGTVIVVRERRESIARASERSCGDAIPAYEVDAQSGCVVGYRVWFVGTLNAASPLRASTFGQFRFHRKARERGLVSLYHGEQIWPPGAAYRADLDDGAGIHAFIDEREMRRYLRVHAGRARLVGGSVALAGEIVVHERGLRATHGYPLRITAGPRKLRREIARLYGCESD